jgi:hypothetical protein
MKIIFFGGVPCRNGEPIDFKGRAGTAYTYSYFLRKEFEKRGIETDMFGNSILMNTPDKIPSGDHVLSVAQRGFTNARDKKEIPDLISRIKAKIPGKITSICDYRWDGDCLEDMIFFARPAQNTANHTYVGWAASPEWLYPDKDVFDRNLLIDHTLYHEGEDVSASIIKQCLEFKKDCGSTINIRRFISGGVETVLSENQKPAVYDRKGLPYPETCKEYNRANVFFVTHRESMGLSVLESAMAGALVVTPRGYINPLFLQDLNHYEHDGVIDWNIVLNRMVSKFCRECALKYNWSNVADKILEYFNK